MRLKLLKQIIAANTIPQPSSGLYNIVKSAIDKKSYYLNEQIKTSVISEFNEKPVAIKRYGSVGLDICTIDKDNYDTIFTNASIVYEPVQMNTYSFRVFFNITNSISDVLNNIKLVACKLNKIGFDTSIIKSAGKFGLVCKSNDNYSTMQLLDFATKTTKGLDVDLSELKFGKLKRASFSLNESGKQDIVIDIGDK